MIKSHKPDIVVHLGDGIEASAASKFPNEEGEKLSTEFKAHNDFLKTVRKTAKRGTDLYFIEGNHDFSVRSQDRLDARIRDLCDYRLHQSELADGYWQMPTEYHYSREKGVLQIGQVCFYHGYETGANGNEMQALALTDPWTLSITGHTHRPHELQQALRTKRVPLPWWYINAGTLRDCDPEYMRRQLSILWKHAVVIGETGLDTTIRSERDWSAELVLRAA